jgi:sugar porter (SP) family MFS transporter
VAALGAFLFGFDTAVISGTQTALEKQFTLSKFWWGFTVASAIAGTVLGSLAVGRPAERWGRKPVLVLLALVFTFSALGCGLAWDWYALVFFRLVGGLAIGGASVAAPMYIAEISPARLRGRLVATSQLNVVIGILCAFLSNYLITLALGEASLSAWRWMFGIMAAPAVLFLFLLHPIPESPRWLVKRQRREEALAVLQRLGHHEPQREIAEIVESLHEEKVSLEEPFFQRKYLQPILLALMISTFNQMSGINALIYYTPFIFMLAGAGQKLALLQSVIIGFTNLVFTIVAMTVIDRFGRKFLLLVGTAGLFACLSLAAYGFYPFQPFLQQAKAQGLELEKVEIPPDLKNPLILFSLIGYIAFFGFSQGAVIWVYISEIFPNRVRARGQALGSFTHWFWCALVTWTFPAVAEVYPGPAFTFFAAMMALDFVLVLKLLPETKGVSLEQIQKRLGIE